MAVAGFKTMLEAGSKSMLIAVLSSKLEADLRSSIISSPVHSRNPPNEQNFFNISPLETFSSSTSSRIRSSLASYVRLHSIS